MLFLAQTYHFSITCFLKTTYFWIKITLFASRFLPFNVIKLDSFILACIKKLIRDWINAPCWITEHFSCKL